MLDDKTEFGAAVDVFGFGFACVGGAGDADVGGGGES